jgi:hypothetical protein
MTRHARSALRSTVVSLRMLPVDFAAYVHTRRCPGRSVRSRTGAGATRIDPGVDVDQATHFGRDI